MLSAVVIVRSIAYLGLSSFLGLFVQQRAVAIAAIALYVPFSLHITLGQYYLPGRWAPPAV